MLPVNNYSYNLFGASLPHDERAPNALETGSVFNVEYTYRIKKG